MAGIDLTEAIEAGGRAAANMAGDWWCPKRVYTPRRECPWCSAEVAIRAAAPIIERQVREQIAAEIEAARDWRANNFVGVNSSAISDTYSESACIARGGAA